MSDRDTDVELNEPECLPGTVYGGPTQSITKAESRQRLIIMERMLASAYSDTEIEMIMEEKHDMGVDAVKRVREKVYAKWAAESADRGPHLKMAAKRRLALALKGATEDRKWTAVANLEKVLSGIEGTTVDPKEAITPTQVRLNESMLAILNEADPNFVIEVIERERTISIRHAPDEEPKQIVIDVEDDKCLSPQT